jgi:membrane protease YdiL (CAAX protease family)
VLFAAYHAYQGAAGAAYSLTFGLAYGIAFLAIRRVWPLVIGHALYNICLEVLAR